MNTPHPLTLDRAWCLDIAWRAAQPRQFVTTSEWADAHRVLTSKQTAEPGRWRTSRNPIMREIMDCFSPTSRVKEVVLMGAAQLLKTEVILNAIGSTMAQTPCPIMVLNPTIEATLTWKAQKWNPVMTDTPAIRDLLGGQRMRDATNRSDMIDYPGGVLFLAGGNSPNSYAAKSVRKLFMDDLDRFPREIVGEGNPVYLALQRLKSFRNSQLCLSSSPTTKDDSLIYPEWLLSDQRKCYLPCPHCGELQWLQWGSPEVHYGVKWNSAVTEAVYVCIKCGVGIGHHHKRDMLEGHRWIAENPGPLRRGYQFSTLYSPIGLGPTWLDMVHDWRMACKDTGKLQVYVNTMLGEVWEAKGESIDPHTLLNRLEAYPTDTRHPARVRTVGIDVQKNRLEMTVMDIGEGEESWHIAHKIIEGDTAGTEPWHDLADELGDLAPDCGGIDSGYNTDQVEAFARSRPWLFVCKGIEGRGKTLIEDDEARKRRLRKKRRKGISPFLVSDEAAKALITQRLKLQALPAATEGDNKLVVQAGYLHFPQAADFDDEFFAQLTSNRLEEKVVRGKRVVEWKQTRVRNEAYDCWKYALAGFRISKLDPAQRARAVAARAAAAEADQAPQRKPRRRGGFVKSW